MLNVSRQQQKNLDNLKFLSSSSTKDVAPPIPSVSPPTCYAKDQKLKKYATLRSSNKISKPSLPSTQPPPIFTMASKAANKLWKSAKAKTLSAPLNRMEHKPTSRTEQCMKQLSELNFPANKISSAAFVTEKNAREKENKDLSVDFFSHRISPQTSKTIDFSSFSNCETPIKCTEQKSSVKASSQNHPHYVAGNVPAQSEQRTRGMSQVQLDDRFEATKTFVSDIYEVKLRNNSANNTRKPSYENWIGMSATNDWKLPAASLDAKQNRNLTEAKELSRAAVETEHASLSDEVYAYLQDPIAFRFLVSFVYDQYQEEYVLALKALDRFSEDPDIDIYKHFVDKFIRDGSTMQVAISENLQQSILHQADLIIASGVHAIDPLEIANTVGEVYRELSELVGMYLLPAFRLSKLYQTYIAGGAPPKTLKRRKAINSSEPAINETFQNIQNAGPTDMAQSNDDVPDIKLR